MKTRGEDLRVRTKRFALAVIEACGEIRSGYLEQVIGRQLVRSGTSVGAQYREADRSRSTAEFISKMESALQELSETEYWLELLVEANFAEPTRIEPLLQEVRELTAIFVASIRTAKARHQTRT